MIIGINGNNLLAPIKLVANQEFLSGALGDAKLHYLSRRDIAISALDLESSNIETLIKQSVECKDNDSVIERSYETEELLRSSTSKFFTAAHNAFDLHANFTLRPEVVWYMIVHEVAICVKQNSKQYAHLFTKSPDKKVLLEVIDNSLIYGSEENNWDDTIEMFRQKLSEHISPLVLSLFLTKFSTSDKESDLATLLAFMDTVSSYYKYQVNTLCGIPQIKIAGTRGDWMMLVYKVNELMTLFEPLKQYFVELKSVLQTICDTLHGEVIEADFWKSFYKFKESSGSASVTGWINTFFAYLIHPMNNSLVLKSDFQWGIELGYKMDLLPQHITSVDFNWNYYETDIAMKFFAGIIGVENDNGFLTPRLGFGVAE